MVDDELWSEFDNQFQLGRICKWNPLPKGEYSERLSLMMSIFLFASVFEVAFAAANTSSKALAEAIQDASYAYHGSWSDTSNGLTCRLSSRKMAFSIDDTIVIRLQFKNVSQLPIPARGLFSADDLLRVRPNENPYYNSTSFPWSYDDARFSERFESATDSILPQETIAAYCRISRYFFQRDTTYTFHIAIDRNARMDNHLSNQPVVHHLVEYPKWKGVLTAGELLIHVKGRSVKELGEDELFRLLASDDLSVYDKDVISKEIGFRKDSIVPFIANNYLKFTKNTRWKMIGILEEINTETSYKQLIRIFDLCDSLRVEVGRILTDHPRKEAEGIYIDMIRKEQEYSTSAIHALEVIHSQRAMPILDSIKNATTEPEIYFRSIRALQAMKDTQADKDTRMAFEQIRVTKCGLNVQENPESAGCYPSEPSVFACDSLRKLIETNHDKLVIDALNHLRRVISPSKVSLRCKKSEFKFLVSILTSSRGDILQKHISDLIRVCKNDQEKCVYINGLLLHMIKTLNLTSKFMDFTTDLSKQDLDVYHFIVKDYSSD